MHLICPTAIRTGTHRHVQLTVMPYLPRQGVPEGVGGLRVRHDVRRLAQVREQQAGVGQQARGGLGAWGGRGMWAREVERRVYGRGQGRVRQGGLTD